MPQYIPVQRTFPFAAPNNTGRRCHEHLPRTQTCSHCGRTFERAAGAGRTAHCSIACARKTITEKARARAAQLRVAVTCLVCGTQTALTRTAAARGAGLYCSAPCRRQAITVRAATTRQQAHGADVRACAACGKEFARRSASQRYCSVACGHIGGAQTIRGARRDRKAIYHCQVCGVAIEGYKTRVRVACSRACYARLVQERQRGANSHLWEGGKTSQALMVRNSVEYAAWRTAVFARDRYTCQLCGKAGAKYLTAHHIVPFAQDAGLRLHVANGITLCRPCHVRIRHKEDQYEAQFFAITGGV